MKKFLFSILILIATGFCAMAQDMAIPADTAVRIGKLENGLTYYIRSNPKPEKQADFYILHNVGAIQEEDNQQGLAHFLEHMAFNGTKNLPGKMLLEYLETVGVKFGANLNAGTGVEQTVYNMSNVPLTREGIVDTCLLILHDWSYFITLDDKEIDEERGVIIEELRTRNTAGWRTNEKARPYLYGDTRYAERNLIGSIEGLKSFPYQDLKDFYHRWYRTDLQAIVIVGDFDADEMEAKVRKVMADIPAVENPEPKAVIEIPGNETPIVGIITDPEQTQTLVRYMIKHEPFPREMRSNLSVYAITLARSMMLDMINYRLEEIAQKPNAPFVYAGAGFGALTDHCDVLIGVAMAREGEAEKAFQALYTEFEKAYRFGFTPSELERVKAETLRRAEKQYDNRNDRRNEQFIQLYLDNYRENTPIPSAETEWELDRMLIPSIDLNTLNMLAKQYLQPENEVVTIYAPEKENAVIPTDEAILQAIASVHEAELEAYADNTVKEPLIPEGTELKGSPVAKTETDRFGATVWTLGNGIKVVVKPTDFKADELRFAATARGGYSNIADQDYYTANMIDMTVQQSGVGKFSSTDLQKQLAGKSASVYPTSNDYTVAIQGVASPKDMETLFQLAYLYFTSPRWEQADFDVLMDMLSSQLKNIEMNPNYVFSKELQKSLYNDNMRRRALSLEMLSQVNFERMPQLYRQLFGNAGDFTFTLVGNVDLNELRPLVEKYIGSLPVEAERTDWKDDGVRTAQGVNENVFDVKMEMPKTTIATVYTGPMPYTLENQLLMSYLSQILRIRYTTSIREQKGGTYSVGVSGTVSQRPEESYRLLINFDTNKEMADELRQAVIDELEKMASEGPTAEEMGKIKEFMVKQRLDQLKLNNAWMGYLTNWYINGLDTTTDYDATLEGITPEKVKATMAKILADGNVVNVIMNPEE